MNTEARSIVLLDFASEMNRGDAVMQIALIDLLNIHFPEHKKHVISVYGNNQIEAFPKHFDSTLSTGVDIIPGVRDTYNFLGDSSSNVSYRRIRNIFNIILSYLKALAFASTRLQTLLDPNTKKFIDTITSSDFVIWNGRNFRNRKGIGELYDLLAMVLHPIYCRILGKKVFAIGVSIWPQKFWQSKFILKKVLGWCIVFTARESFTYRYARDTLNLSNVQLKPDLSFFHISNNQPKDLKTKTMRVSITLTDWTEDGYSAREKYILSIQKLIKHIITKGYTIDIVPQVYYEWESYNDLLDSIQSSFPNILSINIIRRNMSPEELIRHYRCSDFLIATRMHSAIFALTQFTKTIAIPYDSGAKWNILSDLGLKSEYLIDYQCVSGEGLINAFDNALMDSNYFDLISENLPKFIATVEDNILITKTA